MTKRDGEDRPDGSGPAASGGGDPEPKKTMRVEIHPDVWNDFEELPEDARKGFMDIVAKMEELAKSSANADEFHKKMKEAGFEPAELDLDPEDEDDQELAKILEERHKNRIKTT
jgi:hypothetical protein